MKHSFRFLVPGGIAAVLITLVSPVSYAALPETKDILNRLPVQSQGRIKPFQSFAEETLRHVTGASSWKGESAPETLCHWISDPDTASKTPMIPVEFRPLRKEFSLMLIDNRLSPEIIMNHKPFVEKVRDIDEKQKRKIPLIPPEKESAALYEKALIFHEVAEGRLPGWIAHPDNPKEGWFSLEAFSTQEGFSALHSHYPPEKILEIRETLQEFLAAFDEDKNSEKTTRAAREFSETLRGLFESGGIILDRKILDYEILYNEIRPFSWAWKIYVLGLFLALASGAANRLKKAWIPEKTASYITLGIFFAGFLVHSFGFYLRCTVAARPPVTNMYESLIWVSWAAGFFSLIFYLIYRAQVILRASSLISSLALMIAEANPAVLDPSISPLVPVLRSNMWLTIHVLTITLSYGAFALAWGLGHAVVAQHAFWPQHSEKNQKLAQYLYRTLQVGVILLAAGTVLGGVWANYSWGRFWGWDPKETWALIALLGYLTILHGRSAGWLDVFGLSVGAVIAFAGVVMAWYGVNYVLAAGLHSYGFGGGGVPYVMGAVIFDLVFLAWLTQVYKNRSLKLKE